MFPPICEFCDSNLSLLDDRVQIGNEDVMLDAFTEVNQGSGGM